MNLVNIGSDKGLMPKARCGGLKGIFFFIKSIYIDGVVYVGRVYKGYLKYVFLHLLSVTAPPPPPHPPTPHPPPPTPIQYGCRL